MLLSTDSKGLFASAGKFLAVTSLAGFLTLGIFACKPYEEKSGTGRVIMRIAWPETPSSLLAAGMISPQSHPSSVVTIRATVSGTDMAIIVQDYPASAEYGEMASIPIGDDRALLVQALNNSGTTLYEAEKTGLTIVLGELTDAGTLVLIAVTTAAPAIPVLDPQTDPTNLSSVTLTGSKEGNTALWLSFNTAAEYEAVPRDAAFTWSVGPFTLVEGDNSFILIIEDGWGNRSQPLNAGIVLDTVVPAAPTVDPVTTPTNVSSQTLSGSKEIDTAIWINGAEMVPLDALPSWSYSVSLAEGSNSFSVTSRDAVGNESTATTVTIELDTGVPLPPTVTGTSPADGATDIAITSTASLTFSEGMDTTSTEGAFSIVPSVAGTFGWNTGNTVLTFTPSSDLAYSTTYTVTVGTGAQDAAGNPLASAASFGFTTAAAPDILAPTVTGTSPIDGATGVATTASVSVTFSEEMNTTSTEGAFSISPSVSGTFGWNSGSTVLTFTPSDNLADATTYTVTVDTGAQDVAGNSLASTTSFNFTTGTPPGAPSGLIATGGDTVIDLIWQAPASGGTPTSYQLYRGASSPVDTSGSPVATIAAPIASYQDVGLTNLTTYYYRVVASNAGGSSPDSNENSAAPHLPDGGSWQARASMPTARCCLTSSAVNGIIYAIGGDIGGAGSTATEAYDPATNTWAVKSTFATGRGYLTSNVVNGIIYAIGGWTCVGGCSLHKTVEAYDPATDTWCTKTSMPTARSVHTGSVVNGIIYAIGGALVGGSPLATVEVYDPATDTWSTKTPMPTPRGEATASVVNGIIYVIGGRDVAGGDGVSTVEAYDPASDTWSTKTSMPTARRGPTSSVVNGIIYVIGGVSVPGDEGLDTVEAYDPATDTWTTMTPMSTGRWMPASSVVNGVIYAMGGGGGGILNSMEAYTPPALQPEDSWATKAPMPTGRCCLTSSVVNGIVYAIGGDLGGSGSTDMEAYDPATNTWSVKSTFSTGRCCTTSNVVNGIIYVIGGWTCVGGCSQHNTVEAYDPATDTWSTKTPMPAARHDLASGVVNGIIYAIGGRLVDGTPLNTVEAYNPATDTWSTKSPMPTARGRVTGQTVNGIIYVIGGCDSCNPSNSVNTVEAYNPITDTWSTKSSMPTTRSSPSSSVVNGIIYVIGGSDDVNALDTVEAYDPASDTWSTMNPMSTGRWYPSSSVVNGIIYTMGGGNSDGILKSVEAYTPPGSFPVTFNDFTDSLNWSAFDAGANGVATVPNGYAGGVFDGRYIYFAPHHDGTTHQGEVLRYDTQGDFGTNAAWSAFDPGANGVGTNPVGYIGGIFDGRYVYFAPWQTSPGVTHGEVLRYDTVGAFDAVGSWSAFDAGANGVGAIADGFFGGVFDGRYVYFVPKAKNFSQQGEVLRYDTQGAFATAGSWAAFDPGAAGVGIDADAFTGGVFDGRYVYFVPGGYVSCCPGEVLRFDTLGAFDSAGSWAAYDAGANGVGADPDGYAGGVFDGRYLYFVTNNNGTESHGEVLRYDTLGAFASTGSWSTFDPGANGVGTTPDGYAGGVFDGRYVYFVPNYKGADSHGEVLRYDTQGAFVSTGSWATYDPGANGVGTDANGFFGGVFDGRFVYFVPANKGTVRPVEILRFDAKSPPSIPSTVYGGSFF